jgi:hypothetical protein
MKFSLNKVKEKRRIASATTVRKNLFIKEEDLSRIWAVGKQIAHDTLKVTPQTFIRNVMHPIECQFKTKNVALCYNHVKCKFSSDTFFSSVKSSLNNTCGQLFATDFGFMKFIPMKNKSKAGIALKEFNRGCRHTRSYTHRWSQGNDIRGMEKNLQCSRL